MANAQTPTIKYFLAAAALGSDVPRMTISTNASDREGDRVIPEGGDFKNFLKNPVLCWVHDYKHIPIGRVTSIEVQPGKGVDATWSWLENDEFADRIKNAYDQGCINASSIGFIPTESAPNGKGHDITKWEMLELTLCPIPMNPEAVRAMKSLGVFGTDKAVDDTSAPLRAKAATLKAAAVAKSYEFSCGLSAMGCVENLLSMECAEPAQMDSLRIAAEWLLFYLSQEFEECYGRTATVVTETVTEGTVDQNATLDEPLIPMDDDTKYPFVSATGLTGEAKIALVKGINEAFAARVKSFPIVLSLSDTDDLVLDLTDEPRLSLDIKDVDDLLDVDPVALRAALTDIVQTSLRSEITSALQTAVDKARGRVVV